MRNKERFLVRGLFDREEGTVYGSKVHNNSYNMHNRAIEARLLSKSVKFMESADLRVLRGQISLIKHNIEQLVTHPDDIDMVITLGAA